MPLSHISIFQPLVSQILTQYNVWPINVRHLLISRIFRKHMAKCKEALYQNKLNYILTKQFLVVLRYVYLISMLLMRTSPSKLMKEYFSAPMRLGKWIVELSDKVTRNSEGLNWMTIWKVRCVRHKKGRICKDVTFWTPFLDNVNISEFTLLPNSMQHMTWWFDKKNQPSHAVLDYYSTVLGNRGIDVQWHTFSNRGH